MRLGVVCLIAMLAVLSRQTYAQSFQGIAIYPALNNSFPCASALKSLNGLSSPGISVLWGTFGSSVACVKKFTSKFADTSHLVQIHLSNETCRYHHRCYGGELYGQFSRGGYNRLLNLMRPGTKLKIQSRVRSILRKFQAASNPNTTLLLSLGLEDMYRGAAVTNLRDAVLEIWPYQISRSHKFKPISDNDGTQYQELHGSKLVNLPSDTNCIVNPDGTDIDLGRGAQLKNRLSPSQTAQWINNGKDLCKIVFLWRAQWQDSHDKKFIEPMRRTFQFPSFDIRAIQKLLNDT